MLSGILLGSLQWKILRLLETVPVTVTAGYPTSSRMMHYRFSCADYQMCLNSLLCLCFNSTDSS